MHQTSSRFTLRFTHTPIPLFCSRFTLPTAWYALFCNIQLSVVYVRDFSQFLCFLYKCNIYIHSMATTRWPYYCLPLLSPNRHHLWRHFFNYTVAIFSILILIFIYFSAVVEHLWCWFHNMTHTHRQLSPDAFSCTKKPDQKITPDFFALRIYDQLLYRNREL
jgi:hypothetical protein